MSKDYVFSGIASLVLFVALVVAPPFDKPFSWEGTAVKEFTSRTEVFTKQDATLEEMSSGRVGTWLKTSNMIRKHPAGVGLNNWTVHYPKYNAEAGDYYRPRGHDVWGDAHNDYLQMLAELGLVALLLAGLMVFGLWRLYKLIWTQGDEDARRHSIFVGMGLMALFTVMFFSFPLTRTATPMFLGVYLALLAGMASIPVTSNNEKRVAFGPVLAVSLLLLTLAGAYFGKREASGWHHTFYAKALGERIFQPGENNQFANRRMMLLLAEHTDKGISLEPYAPILLRDHIASYTNLSLKIDHERLAEAYREKALETAERYLRTFPYDAQNHMIVATRLGVSNEKAMKHIGKAIELDPGNLQLYRYLDAIALPEGKYDEALTLYEHYIPRFFDENMHQDYAYLGQQAKQEERVIETLGRVDLSKRYKAGSAEYDAAKNKLDGLVRALESSR